MPKCKPAQACQAVTAIHLQRQVHGLDKTTVEINLKIPQQQSCLCPRVVNYLVSDHPRPTLADLSPQ